MNCSVAAAGLHITVLYCEGMSLEFALWLLFYLHVPDTRSIKFASSYSLNDQTVFTGSVQLSVGHHVLCLGTIHSGKEFCVVIASQRFT